VLLPTAAEAISVLRALDKRTLFLSNNTTRSRGQYAAKLTRLGLPTSAREVLTSSVVLVEFLQENLPDARLFVIGEKALQEDLRAAGFRLSQNPPQIEAVIASFDRGFEYSKLQIAFDAIQTGARFFATNADPYCPVPGGGEPDAAAIIAAIEACTGVQVEAIVGKPSPHMAKVVLAVLDLPPEKSLLVGDRLETDVRLGVEAGLDTALVLTGATNAAALAESDLQPTYLLDQLGDLLPAQN
jgi:HAD superfamily hydrolase (TIGR01450 family)